LFLQVQKWLHYQYWQQWAQLVLKVQDFHLLEVVFVAQIQDCFLVKLSPLFDLVMYFVKELLIL
jgi:hypothetical protein